MSYETCSGKRPQDKDLQQKHFAGVSLMEQGRNAFYQYVFANVQYSRDQAYLNLRTPLQSSSRNEISPHLDAHTSHSANLYQQSSTAARIFKAPYTYPRNQISIKI